jgi:hypothetical protein
MAKFELVEFESGKWAVRRRCWYESCFLSTDGLYTWTSPENVASFCLAGSREAAEKVLLRWTPGKIKQVVKCTSVSQPVQQKEN